VGTGITTLSPYSFVSFTDILGNIDMDYLIDVIGILSSVDRERVYERNRVYTKFKVIELESNGIKLECTLFGSYVDALDAFLQSGCNGNVVLVAQYLKEKLYNGKVQLQNALKSTKLSFNPEILEADNLKNIVCIVLGIIKHVIGGNDWWYAACVCNKGVVTDSKRIFFPKCEKHVWTIVPNSGGFEDDLDVGVVHNDIDAAVVRDLGNKFENVVAEEKYGDNGSTSKFIEENAAESTLVKRGIYEVVDENYRVDSRIMKNINI
ncbi:hypothetical protein RYX36_000642, partial [Vicia faba]